MALSCELHTAALYDRGGRKKLADLYDVERVKWERKRDDITTATIYIGTPGAKCQEALGLAEAGRVELVIFRGAERVWEGPISRIAYKGNSVEIEARDVMLYVNRTIMHHEYDNRHPNTTTVLSRVERVLRAELARKEALDPPINVLQHIKYIYVEGTRTYLAAYHSTTGIRRAIGDAKSMENMEAALAGMRDTYGLSAGFGIPAGTSFGGISWLPVRYRDWQLRQHMITTAVELSKYPPEFIKSAGIEGIFFGRSLATSGANFNVGGAATQQRLYLDILDYAAGENMVFGSDHIIHHELMHLMDFNFGTELIRNRWLALNPPGFQYGAGWDRQDYDMNPRGFTRDYGRYSYQEDLAEIAGLVMATSQAPFMDMLMSTDPIVRGKVALYKEWMKSISNGLIDSEDFYQALRNGTVVTPGENGATDARTAARTLPYEMTAFEHIDSYAARGGVDYTVIGRSILFFDVHQRIGQTPMVTEDDFIGDPIITQYGMELATYVAMTDGKGNYGAAGGVDEYYGEWEVLHQAYDEDAQGTDPQDPPSVAEMESQAKRTYLSGSKPPLVVRVPDNTRLNPNGVLTIRDLVPGVWIPLSASLPGRTVSQMQKLDSMTVEETAGGGEEIKVTLSPAYAQTFVEEE